MKDRPLPTTPQPKPLTLERRPSTKQREKGAWIADVAAMTRGQLDTLPRPLSANATRTKLYERRVKEMTG
jgi:hypothetical protein